MIVGNATTILTSRVVPRRALSPATVATMHALLARHFAGVTAEIFARDLAEKNWVILLERQEELVGFSTLHVYETDFRGAPVSVVYSGDTIVAPEAWGSSALPRTWIGAVKQLRREFPRGRYFWLLLTSGFRTYRFLPVFWREFWPRTNAPFPADMRCLRDHLAQERFGAAFDAARGLVRFPAPQRLQPELALVPPGRGVDPHIAFFLDANPGHAAGDELVCLTELDDNNLTPAGRRMVGLTTRSR